MQRIALLSLLVLALLSCEDLEDNNAIIQGNANDVFLKGGAVATRYDNGTIVIAGITDDDERLNITLAGSGIGAYNFGPGSRSGAEFTDASGETYNTATELGNGEALINENNPTDNVISGTFFFNAHTFALQDTLNFQRGVFFKVPVIGGTGNPDDPGFPQGISADINGAPFEAVTYSAGNINGFIIINGTEGGNSISLSFPNNYFSGSFDLALGEFEAAYGLDGVATPATSGTLTIIGNNVTNGEVQGTFSIAGDGFEVINGSFSLIY